MAPTAMTLPTLVSRVSCLKSQPSPRRDPHSQGDLGSEGSGLLLGPASSLTPSTLPLLNPSSPSSPGKLPQAHLALTPSLTPTVLSYAPPPRRAQVFLTFPPCFPAPAASSHTLSAPHTGSAALLAGPARSTRPTQSEADSAVTYTSQGAALVGQGAGQDEEGRAVADSGKPQLQTPGPQRHRVPPRLPGPDLAQPRPPAGPQRRRPVHCT